MIKAVIFDLDDTLVSEKEYVISGFKVVSREISYRYNLDYNDILTKMREFFDVSSKNVFNRVLDLFYIDYSNEDILELIDIYRNHKPDIKFYDDVIPTINILKEKGIKVGIITDGYKETQNKKIEVLKCRKLFDEIIVTDELGREFWKPHEKAYLMMSERLGVNLNEMIYIGDNEKKDFIGANKLGIFTVMVKKNEGIYKEIEIGNEFKARYKLDKISNIREIIYKN